MKELEKKELMRVEGGIWAIIGGAILTYYVVESLLNYKASIKAFKEGWNIAAAEDK